uniref:Uncharacterized protein n=1 Tax=Sphaerodactylus townsendi TaxID=933632 RepID=A0ACB8F856_9SAUR
MFWPDWSLLLALTAAVKLAGGTECQRQSVPWQVTLRSERHVCSGALISAEWVLAAAQCSRSPEHMEVWLGKHVPQTPEETQQVIAATKEIPHEEFNSHTLDFDIMLLKLSHPVSLDEFVQPISPSGQCVPTGTLCLAAEWGGGGSSSNTEDLQCTNLSTASDATCNNAFPGRFTERMTCAEPLASSQDSCKGDVGSPLACQGDLQGLLSWNRSCSEEYQLGLYTRVCAFHAWIEYTMANN